MLRQKAEQMLALAQGNLAKQTGIVYLSQIVQAILGFILNLTLIRTLPVDSYGTFSVFVSAFLFLGSIAHWGWSETYVRFAAAHRETNAEGFFRRKILIASGTTALFLAAASGPLAKHFYERPDWQPLLLAAAVAGFFTCGQSFEMNRLRLLGRFWLYFGALAAGSIFRLISVAVLILAGTLAAPSLAAVYLASPLLVILLVWFLTPPSFAPTAGAEALSRESKKYNFWMAVSLYATCIVSNLDVHLIAAMKDSAEAARLGAASRLTLPITMLVASVTTTLLPKLSQSQQDPSFTDYYLRKIKLVMPWLLALFLIGGALAVPLLSLLAGKKYSGLELLLGIQLLSTLVVLATNPLSLVLLAGGQTKNLALMNLGQLAVGTAAMWALIPRFGAEGAAAATVLVNLIGFTTIAFLLRRRKWAT